jgi:hypothetical protein
LLQDKRDQARTTVAKPRLDQAPKSKESLPIISSVRVGGFSEGVDYARTLAQIAGLKGLSANKEADRKVFRRDILERVLKYKKR